MPLNGESNELVSRFAAEVERARTDIEGVELRGMARNSVREVCEREAIVGEECCGQLRLMGEDELRNLTKFGKSRR